MDHPVTLTYPDGEIVTTGYDKQVVNSLHTSHNNSTLVSDVTYNHRLEMTGQLLGNNLTQTYSYYPASGGNYRLNSTNLKLTNSSVSRYNRSYQYDPVGNITQIVTDLQGQSQETQTFSYDSLDRLKTAQASGGPTPYNHSGSNDYDYDPIGNITSLAGSSSYNYTSWHNNCAPPPHSRCPMPSNR
ncbi:MAG: hypothetical protein KJ063_25370 [Anaerolineae bacterium]|nr:hypothetical protein [Anaerolineae bacterium]